MSISKRIKILVISEGNTAKDPRPKRVIENFKSSCLVTTIGINVSDIEDVNVLSYPASKRRSFFREILLYINIFTRRYMQLVDIPSRKKIQIFMQEESYDVIFCHSLVLLPLVLKYKKNAKVIFDAREYYPKEQEHNYRWRILFKNFNHWLCKTYLPLVDYVYSVSKGLSQQYEYDYNISCNTIMSLPAFYDIKPSKIEKKIKLIYHGVASEDRYIHLMIEMMDYVDDRFQLDLMLMGKGSDYYNYLCNKIKKERVYVLYLLLNLIILYLLPILMILVCIFYLLLILIPNMHYQINFLSLFKQD